MPSGPKKRKADKKRKANLQSPTNSQGSDDLKSHDEKESDGGDLSSPASQDHHNHPFEGDDDGEQEKRDSSSDVPVKGSDVVREFKSDEDSESQNVSIEYVESVKEEESRFGGSSGDAGSSGSSSNSSSFNSFNDESRPIEKNHSVIQSGKLEEYGVFNSIMETNHTVGSVEPVVSSSDEVTIVEVDIPVEETGDSEVNELGLKEKEEKMLSLSDGIVVAPVVTVLAISDEDTGTSPGVMDLALKENGDKLLCLADARSVEISNGGEDSKGPEIPVAPVVTGLAISDEITGTTSGVVDLASKENGDKLLRSADARSVETSNGGEDSEGPEIPVAPVVTALAISDEITGTTSGVLDLASKENGDKLLRSSDARNVETSIGGEHSGEPDIPESSENQRPVMTLTPRPVQLTSWRSCCGLFEVLKGSNR